MEYKGAEYTVVQTGPDEWRWTIHLPKTTISGIGFSREAAIILIELRIDDAVKANASSARQTRRAKERSGPPKRLP